MTTKINQNIFQDKWTNLVSESAETAQRNNERFWLRTKQITTCALAALAVLTIAAPLYFASSIATGLLFSLNFLPVAPPLFTFLYSYLSSKQDLAKETADRIHSLRETTSPSMEELYQETFSSSPPPLSSSFTPCLSSLIHHLKQKEEILNQEHGEKLHDILHHADRALSSLLSEVMNLFPTENQAPLISVLDKLAHRSLEEENPLTSPPLSFSSVQEELKPFLDDPAYQNLMKPIKKMLRDLESFEKVEPNKKWAPLHTLEEQCVAVRVERLFLWALVLRQDEELTLSYLDQYGVHMEKALYTLADRSSHSLADRAIALQYADPSAHNFLKIGSESVSIQSIKHEPENVVKKILSALPSSKIEEEKAS